MQAARHGWVWGFLGLCLWTLAGCGTPPKAQLDEARAAYDAQRHQDVLRLAGPLANTAGRQGDEAAYLAGMSAVELKQPDLAERYLGRAAQSDHRELAGDALATLGMLANSQQRYSRGSEFLLRAADKLTGPDRANAYLQAGIAQQKLGWWPQARATLMLARQSSGDPRFLATVNAYLETTGFTLQFGAYNDVRLAQDHVNRLAKLPAAAAYGSPRAVRSADDAGRLLYRVHLGRFSSHMTAGQARQQLGISDSIIVPLTGD